MLAMKTKNIVVIPPYLSIDTVLKSKEIQLEEIQQDFPQFLFQAVEIRSRAKALALHAMQLVIQACIYLVLRPRSGLVGIVDASEVESVYEREAATYDIKHHLTTRGMDTNWRRMAGWCVLAYEREKRTPLKILDLCTGTGLAVQEMLAVFSDWKITGEITGLDYSTAMLAGARRRRLNKGSWRVAFVRGDATHLVEPPAGFASIAAASHDIVTQVFGIGGIAHPEHVFTEVLRVLKPEGRYFLIDMHRPILNQPGELPTPFGWFPLPFLEATTYVRTTIPLALKRLWGWRDTTLDFYTLPLCTWQGEGGIWWGFRVQRFDVESERWWFGLSVMPTAKMVTEKVELTVAEVKRRAKLLDLIEQSRCQ